MVIKVDIKEKRVNNMREIEKKETDLSLDISKANKEIKDYEKASKVNAALIEIMSKYVNLNSKLRLNDRREVEKSYAEFYRAFEEYNYTIYSISRSFDFYKSPIEMLSDMQNQTMKSNKYLKVLEVLPDYKNFINAPVLINGEVNPIIREQMYGAVQSRVKGLLVLCRENSHINYANELYTYIRMSMNKASITIGELQEIFRKINEMDVENIIPGGPVTFYLGPMEGVALYGQDTYQPEIGKFCKHCNRLLRENESKCKGSAVCSFYYKKNECWYEERVLGRVDTDVVYTISDEYYNDVTLPNLFEKLIYDIFVEGLSSDEFLIDLHPEIERLGDIRVVSKRTGKEYLFDAKNYNSPANLKKYILDNRGTVIKSLIHRNSKFIFVVPSHHMKSSLVEYISNEKGINKFGYIIKNELNIVKWLLEEDSKYESNLLGGLYAK